MDPVDSQTIPLSSVLDSQEHGSSRKNDEIPILKALDLEEHDPKIETPIPKVLESEEHDSKVEEEKEVHKQNEEIKDPGYSSKKEDKLSRLAKRESLFALRRSSYQFPVRPPYYKPNSDSEEELADLYMTREEWNTHLEKHPDAHPFHLKIIRYFECGIKGELPPRKSRQAKSDNDSDYELPEDDSVGCLSGIYATHRLAEECGGGFNGENNPHFTRDVGFTVDDDDYADDEDNGDDFTDEDDDDDDGYKDEIVVNSV